MRTLSWRVIRVVAVALGVALGFWAVPASAEAQRPSPFASLVERLSESGREFGSDNLISNEQSYLQVMPALEQAHVGGGAYIGVGPEQNFSYIAHLKPAVAYLIDLRRDNLLLHLLFKALFAQAPTRVEYLSLLTGRAPPPHAETWSDASIDQLVAYIDDARAMPATDQKTLRARLEQTMQGFGVPLTPGDLDRIDAWHRQFIDAGLSIVFEVRGRSQRDHYPSFRVLLREMDPKGRQLSFLAAKSGFQFVRSMEARDLIVPVVGDVSGPKAMAAIAADMNARGEPLSAFYISNVEQYLFRDGSWPRYVENLKHLPGNDRSTMIRSVFRSGYRGPLPQSVPGHYSTSLTQSLSAMLADVAANRYRSYADLVLASAR